MLDSDLIIQDSVIISSDPFCNLNSQMPNSDSLSESIYLLLRLKDASVARQLRPSIRHRVLYHLMVKTTLSPANCIVASMASNTLSQIATE
jgi:hypothetical protein